MNKKQKKRESHLRLQGMVLNNLKFYEGHVWLMGNKEKNKKKNGKSAKHI